MKVTLRPPRFIRQVAILGLIVSAMLVACGPTEEPAPVLPTTQPTTEAVASPTTAFRVELPTTVASTPTQEGAPTSTPRPTNTPRPPRTPTSSPSDKPNTSYIPGGEFVMGSDDNNEDETPQQMVFLDAFNIDIYPVTNAEYKEFVDATDHQAPRNWREGTYSEGKGDHPVIWVTWHDAVAYAEWVGKRLPTEAEWEKVARGTEGLMYPWGNDFDNAKANSNEAGIKGTTSVGSFPDGASAYGAMDMAGNVWEWTADWYDAYRGSIYEFSRFGEEYKVLRGGSWFDGADFVRSSARNSADPNFSFSTIGFRCAE